MDIENNSELGLDKREPLFSISTAARLLRISIHTLRMYEKEGLILPFKKTSRHRLYSKEDLERIECIRSAINKDKISIQGIKTILSLIPCWNIVNCQQTKETCPSLNGHSQPCWSFKHENSFCHDRDCRNCEVYRSYSNCAQIKDKLFNLTNN